MMPLDPIFIMTLTKAVDFLFNEAGKLMEERRNAKKARGEEVDLPAETGGTVTTQEEVNTWQVKNVYLRDFHQEAEHYLDQIHQYRANKRLLEEQAGAYGGFRFAPLIIQNQIIITEDEIKGYCERLKALVEEVYGHEITIVGLS